MRLDIRQEGSNVHLIVDERLVATLPWDKAQEAAKFLGHLGRQAEQHHKANELVIADAALIRSGAPFSLTNDRKIREAAFLEAQWGGSRKRIPMRGVPSRKECGTPSIIKVKR